MARIDHSVFVDGFYTPGDPVVNPLTPEAFEVTVAWAWEVGILTEPSHERQLRSFGPGTLTGAGLPEATLEQLILAHQGMFWFVLLDDQLDNPALPEPVATVRAVREQIGRVFDEPGYPTQPAISNPFISGLSTQWERLRQGCTTEATRRLRYRYLEYLDGIERQAFCTSTGTAPDLMEFITMRRATVGMLA